MWSNRRTMGRAVVTLAALWTIIPPPAGAETCGWGFAHEVIAEVGEAPGQLSHPEGVSVGWYVYVADTGNDRVALWHFGIPATFERTWGGPGTGPGQFNRPTDVAVAPWTWDVYVVDSANDRIQVFSAEGSYLREWGAPGSEPGQFNAPNSISVDDSLVYVTDTGNHRVQCFTHAGEFRRMWGAEGSAAGEFMEPAGIRSACGEIYVVDRALARVQVFTGNGSFVEVFGSPGSGDGQLSSPAGIADGCGLVLIADTGNDRLVVGGSTGHWQCSERGHAFADVTPEIGWESFAVDVTNSQLVEFYFPDPVIPSTWGAIKALHRP